MKLSKFIQLIQKLGLRSILSDKAYKEYQDFRIPVFKTYFTAQLIIGIVGILFLGVFVLLGKATFSLVYIPITISLLIFLMWFLRRFEAEGQVLAILTFGTFYIAGNNVFRYDNHHFTHVECYFYGACIQTFLITLHHYVNDFMYLMLLTFVQIMQKIFIIGTTAPVMLTVSIVFDILFLMAKYSREKSEQILFSKFYNYREELVKFKELISDSLPQGLLVIQDVKQWLFKNKFFETIFSQETRPEEFFSSFTGMEVESKIQLDYAATIQKKNRVHQMMTLLESVTNFSQDPKKKIQQFFAWQGDDEVSIAFQIILQKIIWNGNDAISIFFTDVTDQQQIAALKVADQQKDKILATVSHELRTPLNVMNALLTVTQDQTKNGKVLSNVKICLQNINLLTNLVNSILDMNLIQTGNFNLRLQEIHPNDILEHLRGMFEYSCEKKGIEFKAELDSEVPSYFCSDQDRIIQLLTNLIGNAIKFTIDGYVKVGCRTPDGNQLEALGYDLEAQSQLIQFYVQDTGAGIKEKDKRKLFTMYGKLQDTASTNSRGIGLGLTICKALASQLCEGQQIQLESKYGEGSRFSFFVRNRYQEIETATVIINQQQQQQKNTDPTVLSIYDEFQKPEQKVQDTMYVPPTNTLNLPPRKTSQLYGNQQTSQAKSELDVTGGYVTSPRKNLRKMSSFRANSDMILAVDDNPYNIMVLKALLKKNNFDVRVALNGKEAVKQVEKDYELGLRYSVILMDLQMPFMDGFEATEKIIKYFRNSGYKECPIVALSANDSENDVKRCKAVGMKTHVTKPIDQTKLNKVIEKWAKANPNYEREDQILLKR